MSYKIITAKMARSLSDNKYALKMKEKEQGEYKKALQKYNATIYDTIEKEAKKGNRVAYVSVVKNKDHVKLAIERIQFVLEQQGYDVILEKGIFTNTLNIAW